MPSVLTQLGMFHCQQQNRALHEALSLKEYITSILGGYSSGGLLLTLERAVTQSFIAPACDLSFLHDRLYSKKIQNPLHVYGKYKILGLFSLFYLGPLLLRNYHIDLLAKSDKNYLEQLVALILYAPRLFCLFYELAVNIVLYLPLRILNFFCNHESRYLASEKYELAQDAIDLKITNTQISTNYSDDEVNKVFKHFNKDNSFAPWEITVLNRLVHQIIFLDDATENKTIDKKITLAQRKEIIAATCAAGYFGQNCHDETVQYYRQQVSF